MAKASIILTNLVANNAGGFDFEYKVVSDLGHAISSGGPINLVSSVPTMVSDIKSIARQLITDAGGPSIPNADITVFGGPQ